MDGLIRRLSPVLHLTRMTTAFAAVGNTWFVILWSRAAAMEQDTAPEAVLTLGLPAALGAGALVAVGLYTFAVALNDTLDVRRDRTLHPERPLPSGRMRPESAVTLVAASLVVAALGASVLGIDAVTLCLLTAGAILLFNSAARYVPSVGLVLLGLIYAAHMLIANVQLVFVWPVWLAMTHALIVGAVTHVLGGRRPTLSGRVLVVAAAGWLFWSSVLLWVGMRRAGSFWPESVSLRSAGLIALLVLAFGFLAWWKARAARTPGRAAEKIHRYGSLWLTLYATGWMLGEQLTTEAMILGGLALVGFTGMTTLREVYSLLEFPVGYRR
ncbi:MAG: hypothetical protein AAFX05_01830 [Planctomycetota bacterium]